MPSRLIFCPIEPYKSRYTQYNSVKNGVYETEFKKYGINFLSIRPDEELRVIKQGQVLDVVGRTEWGFAQHITLVKMICNGEIDSQEDVIFYEDLWTPGMEQLMYACSSKFGPARRDHPKVYSFCHAQTLDRNDFTFKWAWWMRPLEKAWWDYQERIFCAAREMYAPAADAGFRIIDTQVYKLNAVGHAFNQDVMFRVANVSNFLPEWSTRKKQVVFASRFDSEKNPNFFMDLIEEVNKERDDINFVISTGQPILSSNNKSALERLQDITKKYSVEIWEDISKEAYYHLLRRSKVLFNCAIQDWISYVLIDGVINGCAPLFPKWLSFPDALEDDERFLYENLNLRDAKAKLYSLVDLIEDPKPQYLTKKYEDSVKRMLYHMGFKTNELENL